MKELVPQDVLTAIADQYRVAATRAVSHFREEQADEDAVTGSLGTVMRDTVNGSRTVGGAKYSWHTRQIRIRGRGRGAPESMVGADAILEINVRNGDEIVDSKLVPIQAKKEWNGRDVKLEDQTRKMLTTFGSALVVNYQADGYFAADGVAVIEAGADPKHLSPGALTPLGDMLAHRFIGCTVGSQGWRFDETAFALVPVGGSVIEGSPATTRQLIRTSVSLSRPRSTRKKELGRRSKPTTVSAVDPPQPPLPVLTRGTQDRPTTRLPTPDATPPPAPVYHGSVEHRAPRLHLDRDSQLLPAVSSEPGMAPSEPEPPEARHALDRLMGPGLISPIQRRFEAEDLVRRRRSDEQARIASSQRQGRIDPNPHQIDAVMFALGRIPEGGCILADEVGLGKTIEAGLVLAQLRAEGKGRLLIIVPKPLLGQWQNELFTLFGIEARIGSARPDAFDGTGVFIVGRELAGTEVVSRILASGESFDLVVIDEAHELFAGIYRRFDRRGDYKEESKDALIAQRVREAIGAAPVLLLTATPIQNSLAELWGLVQYVEPTGTLLGNLDTFRKVFCPGDDAKIADGQDDELRRRMSSVCRRTLRRQAQEFMERPFVQRRCRLFEYTMEPDERALYDDVTRWLLDPDLVAFSGGSRHLLLLGFHRRMASSTAALATSLERVCARLERIVRGDPVEDVALRESLIDLEEDEEEIDLETHAAPAPHIEPARVRAELERVRTFAGRARRLGSGAKAAALLQAMKQLGDRKVLVFTSSLATQDFLLEFLVGNGFAPADVTLFRGTNNSPRAAQALDRWRTESPSREKLGRDIAVRLALVHEFKTRSRVMIATEAGAKGLNLQFCDVVVNYDLPWNPQRIEQRIGRCHRYGQEHDHVTVVNFISADNEADRLTFEILARKLDLFGRVLDASDHVLHEPTTDTPEAIAGSLGVAVERELQRIHEQARSKEQLIRELTGLRDEVDARRRTVEEGWQRAASLIQSRLDEDVQRVFRRIRDGLTESLAGVDRAVDRVVTAYLEARAIPYRRTDKDGRILLDVDGTRFVIGSAKGIEVAEPLHLGHSLVARAIEDARRASAEMKPVRVNSAHASPRLREMRGQRGRLVIAKVGYAGFEPVERLIVLAAADRRMLEPELARELIGLPVETASSGFATVTPDELIDDGLGEAVFLDQEDVEAAERVRFDVALARLERSVEDRTFILRRRLIDLEKRRSGALAERDRALSADARERSERTLKKLEVEGTELEMALVELEQRTEEAYRTRRDALTLRRTPAPSVERLVDVEFEIS